ncbi:hypothetical protein C8R43DRAFT_1229019 [Mycena crocata]|nr:hypothetical protein C8R43DRAFT_1229019 [Mycena crocata]
MSFPEALLGRNFAEWDCRSINRAPTPSTRRRSKENRMSQRISYPTSLIYTPRKETMFTREPGVRLPPAAAKASHDTDRTVYSSNSHALMPTHRGLQRADSQNTRYMNMLLALDSTRLHNMLAVLFTWILLVGFVLLPGAFTSLQSVGTNADNANEKAVIEAIQDVPLPGALNSLGGIISTLVNVYGGQHGVFVTTSRVTIIVTVAAAVLCGALTLTYSLFMLKNVKKADDRQVGQERAGKHGEGILEGIKRKAGEIQPEAGMYSWTFIPCKIERW